jgi:trans-aconitate methyltransferase
VLYDLGCGDGKVLRFLSDIFPEAEYIGVERNLFPFYLGLFRKTISRKKFLILNKNFFNLDFVNATHIFVYLHPDILVSLSSYLDKKLSSGTRLVSLDYPFPNHNPAEIIKLKNNSSKLGKRLYIYNF